MFETLLNFFQNSPLSLWGPFIVLLLCGLGLPIPEDIVLVTAGVLGQIDGRVGTVLLLGMGKHGKPRQDMEGQA